MSRVYRTDIEDKPIVHGRRYFYLPNHPYAKRVEGEIMWDRDTLAYIFYPVDFSLPAISVFFDIDLWEDNWKVLKTSQFARVPKERSNGVSSGVV